MRDSANNSLTFVLVALLVARAAVAAFPGTWLWSLQLQRFDPVLWVLWGIAALALIPVAGRAAGPALEGCGRLFERAPGALFAAWAVGVGALVFALTDRTWFTGDFLLRVGVLDSRVPIARIAPQSLPLDLALHVNLPRWLAAAGWITSPAVAARGLGALEAAGLALLVLSAAGLEGRRGTSRIVYAGVLLGGAGLSLLAGYGKSAGEMAIAAIAIAVLARRVAREGRGAAMLGMALALALLAHRSALLLVPAAAAAWFLAARSGVRPRGGPALVLGALLPAGVLVALAPRLGSLLVGFDLPRHLGGGDAGWRGLLSPIPLLDRLNVVLAYAPLAPALAIRGRRAVSVTGAPASRAAGTAVDWALFAPAIALLLAVTPQQGVFRDWDVFVIPGTLIALATARAVSERVAGSGLGAAVLAAALLGAGSWLAVEHATDAGLRRVRAFAAEAPERDPIHVAKVWEFLGDRAAALGRWEEAAVTLREAVVHQPSPRLYLMLSMAEAQSGRLEAAEAAAAAAAGRDSSDAEAWLAWLTSALRRGDAAGAREAARGLRRVAPEHPLVRQVLGDSASAPAAGR